LASSSTAAPYFKYALHGSSFSRTPLSDPQTAPPRILVFSLLSIRSFIHSFISRSQDLLRTFIFRLSFRPFFSATFDRMGFIGLGSLTLVSLGLLSLNAFVVAVRPHHHEALHHVDGGGNHHHPGGNTHSTSTTFTTTRRFTRTHDASPISASPPPSFPVPDFHRPSKRPSSTTTMSTTTASASASSSTSSTSKYPPLDYSLVKCYSDGGSFFDNFNFFTGSDPTHGFVEFVDERTAYTANLAYEQNGVAVIASDSTNFAPSGRKSVRLESKDFYDEVLIIADFAHLPSAACGTWPAFWTANLGNWPNGGEIDIIEGVNLDTVNHVALHTSAGCTVSDGDQTSSLDTTNCDVYADGNAGCGGFASSSTSYGDAFNEVGGGVYAMDWRAGGIRVWSFTRDNIPEDILAGNPTTADWPVPDFDFTGPDSNIPSHFYSHQIIFDLTYILSTLVISVRWS